MAAVGGRIAIRHALIEVRFIVAIEVMQARDLVAPEDVEPAIDDPYAQGLVEARRKALPADVLEVGVESTDEPDFAGHRADRRGAVGEEVQAAQEHERTVRILERHGDGVGRKGLPLPDRALRLDPLRPLCWPALGEERELRGILWSAPSRGKHCFAAASITENGLRAVTVEAVVDGILRRLAERLLAHERTQETAAVVEAVAHLAQLHEATLPLQWER